MIDLTNLLPKHVDAHSIWLVLAICSTTSWMEVNTIHRLKYFILRVDGNLPHVFILSTSYFLRTKLYIVQTNFSSKFLATNGVILSCCCYFNYKYQYISPRIWSWCKETLSQKVCNPRISITKTIISNKKIINNQKMSVTKELLITFLQKHNFLAM